MPIPGLDGTRKIIRNRLRCKICGDVIESKYTWDFKYCKCGKVAIDGGIEYIRVLGNMDDIEMLPEYEEE